MGRNLVGDKPPQVHHPKNKYKRKKKHHEKWQEIVRKERGEEDV